MSLRTSVFVLEADGLSKWDHDSSEKGQNRPNEDVQHADRQQLQTKSYPV